VRLEVFDAKGRLVDVLIDGRACPAGVHTVPWNGEGRAGGRVSSGVYFYRFRAGNVTLVKKMVMTQ
jgi:flagellar hook assembly protein FlgD